MIAKSCPSAVTPIRGEPIYDETTALHEAVWTADADECERLIDEGADVNARCEHVYWPFALEISLFVRDEKRVRTLQQTPLHLLTLKIANDFYWEIDRRLLRILELLLDAGVDANAKDARGYTSMYLYCRATITRWQESRAFVWRDLLAHGARLDISPIDEDPWTNEAYSLVHLAAGANVTEIIIEYAAQGGDVNVRAGYRGNRVTPLHAALQPTVIPYLRLDLALSGREEECSREAYKALIASGADEDVPNGYRTRVRRLAIRHELAGETRAIQITLPKAQMISARQPSPC